MSTWTDEKHEEARKWVDAEGMRDTWAEERGDEFLADALDEIERLRALTTITDDKVRAAAREFWLSNVKDRVWGEAAWDDMGGGEPCAERALVEIAAERALEAALNPKEIKS